MTEENFLLAEKLRADIKSLKNIQKEFENHHWISFYGAHVKEQPISNGILREDLEKFIDKEIDKLAKEFEKL